MGIAPAQVDARRAIDRVARTQEAAGGDPADEVLHQRLLVHAAVAGPRKAAAQAADGGRHAGIVVAVGDMVAHEEAIADGLVGVGLGRRVADHLLRKLDHLLDLAARHLRRLPAERARLQGRRCQRHVAAAHAARVVEVRIAHRALDAQPDHRVGRRAAVAEHQRAAVRRDECADAAAQGHGKRLRLQRARIGVGRVRERIAPAAQVAGLDAQAGRAGAIEHFDLHAPGRHGAAAD